MVINIFQPPYFEKENLDTSFLNSITNKNFLYASKGRYSIWHILKSLNVNGTVLVSPYMCPTILKPLNNLNLQVGYFDIDENDLNPNVKSIEHMLNLTNAKAVIVASLYGNPANLTEIQKLCEERNVIMVDDAAQSFGAKLDGQYVGTFGNAGLFSFSPGKATAAHMGSFFWSDNESYYIYRTNHWINHYISYLNFYYNRYKIYDNNFKKITSILGYIERLLNSISDISNDNICDFEEQILGGVLNSLLNGMFDFRKKYFSQFGQQFSSCDSFQIIRALRGEPHNHKIVLKFNLEKKAKAFRFYLGENGVFTYPGYSIISPNRENLDACKEVENKIVEIPIEDNEEKMCYLYEKVNQFLG